VQGLSLSSSISNANPRRGKGGDQRSRRTRDRLSWSLIELVQEKGFDETTVQDIAARAEVGRSTFYAHFSDKDDVFLQHFTAFMRSLGENLVWEAGTNAYRLPVQGFYQHVQQMRPLYAALAKSRKLESTFRLGRIVLAESIGQRLARDGRATAGVPAAIIASFVAGTFLDLLLWWMGRRNPYRPQRMDEYFHRLVMPGMAAAFGVPAATRR
jgi:AcrR family transcriptional regulator